MSQILKITKKCDIIKPSEQQDPLIRERRYFTINIYTQKLIGQIEDKRKLSITEFTKSDLYSDISLDDLNAWYSQLQDRINKKPPKQNVQQLTVYENEKGRIMKIEYRYYESEQEPTDYVSVTIIQQ